MKKTIFSFLNSLLFIFFLFSTQLQAESCSNPYFIGVPDNKNGTLSTNTNQNDYYRFTAPSSGSITIYTTGYSGDMDAYMYDANCNYINIKDDSGNNNINLTFNVTSGTSYVIRLYAYSGNSNYTLYTDMGSSANTTTWIKNAAGDSATTDPSPYLNDSDATETLTIAGATELDVTITGTLETYSSGTTCGWDYVTITDSAGTVSQRYCDTISDNFTAVGPSVSLYFHSDQNTVASGVTVSIAIPAANAQDNQYSTEPDTQLVVNATDGLLGNDTGSGITITATDLSGLQDPGSIVINTATGAFTYTPPAGFTGSESFEYTITDSNNNESSAVVTITVAVVPDFDSSQGFDLVNPDNTRNIIGDYKIAGNTILCLTENTSTFATSEDQCVDTTNMSKDATSNNYIAKFIDIDGGVDPALDRTWNSSSSFITLPNSYRTVLWAGLFWQGRFARSSSDIHYGKPKGIGYEWVDIGDYDESRFNVDFLKTEPKAQNILLKIDRGTNTTGTYNTVTASKMYYDVYSDGITFSARADVTYLLRQAALEKNDKVTFTIGNLPTSEGRESSPGIYGGWSIVVIYAEDVLLGKPRNITIHSGMKTLTSSSGDQTIDIEGFKLPSSGNTVTASLSMFSGEGEYDYTTDGIQINSNTNSTYQNMPSSSSATNIFDAKMDGITRDDIAGHENNLQNNNVGVDVDNFDLSGIMSAYDRQNTNKLTLKMYSNQDYIIPGMLAFKTELYQPTMCYDYTLEVGGYVIPSEGNTIDTNIGAYTNAPMVTRISIQSKEGDYDFQDVNMTYMIVDTNHTEYIPGTTEIARNDQFAYVDASGQTIDNDPDGFLIYLGEGASTTGGGLIRPYEKRFIKFENSIESDVNTQFQLLVEYTVDYGGPTRAHIAKPLTEDDYCRDGGGYFIASDIFNVTSDQAANDSGQPYNLYTQVANRPFDVKVFSHDLDHINDDHRLKAADTAIEVEIFNADFFPRDVNLSCLTPDSNISSSTFVDFTNDTSVLLSGLSVNYAVRNAGFRTWYLNKSDGSVVSHHCTDKNNQSCWQTVYSNELKSSETADKNCTTPCAASSGCYSCLRQFFAQPICSKDNFAIRPEAFVTSLRDNSQSSNSLATPIKNIAHSVTNNNANVIAGYEYRFDVNATTYTGDAATPGYYRTFDSDSADYSSKMQLRNKAALITADNCNDFDDKFVKFTLFNGTNVNTYQNLNEKGQIEQVGLYELNITDSNWTAVDWHTSKTVHHNQTGFNTTDDCLSNSGSVTVTGQPGCEIRNTHTTPSGTVYNMLAVNFYPYSFNTAFSINPALPASLLTYMNTLYPANISPVTYLNLPDQNMSYNIVGEFSPTGYDGNETLSNFVNNCFARDVDMTLRHRYLSPVPGATEDATLTYDLIDLNKTNPSTVVFPRKRVDTNLTYNTLSFNNAVVVQDGNLTFAKDMKSSIFMDLGFNFDRDMINPTNPRLIEMKDFNLSLSTQPTTLHVDLVSNYQVSTSPAAAKVDQNVTFAYARAQPTKYFYDDITTNSATTPVSITVYCDLGLTVCQNRGLGNMVNGLLQDAQSNESFWWYSEKHNVASDGNVLLSASNGGTVTPTAPTGITIVAGKDNTISVGNTGGTPNIVNIDFVLPPNTAYTDRWLIYNKNANTVPSPFYRVRFIGSGTWSTTGNLPGVGSVVGDDINKQKSNRVEW